VHTWVHGRAAVQYDDVMSWIRATYSRRELVFSLVETANTDDDDVSAATIEDPATATTVSSSRHKTSRRRNASLKVVLCLLSPVHFAALSPVHTSNNVEATLSYAKVKRCFDNCCQIRQQCRNFVLSTKFETKSPFDKVETS